MTPARPGLQPSGPPTGHCPPSTDRLLRGLLPTELLPTTASGRLTGRHRTGFQRTRQIRGCFLLLASATTEATSPGRQTIISFPAVSRVPSLLLLSCFFGPWLLLRSNLPTLRSRLLPRPSSPHRPLAEQSSKGLRLHHLQLQAGNASYRLRSRLGPLS